MDAFTSPTEVLAASLMMTSTSSNATSKKTTTTAAATADAAASAAAQEKRTVFKMSGVEMAVPYNITVVLETSNPAAAEQQAHVIAKDVFQLAKTHLSQFESDSEISKFNSSNDSSSWLPLSSVLGPVVREAQAAGRATGNAFSPVTSTTAASPTFDALFELEQDPSSCVLRLRKKASAAAAAQLDLCGIAKGFVVDMMACRLLAAGFTGVLVDWGGDIKAMGTPPTSTADSWNVSVLRPGEKSSDQSNNNSSSSLALRDMACATSGNFMQQKPHIRSPNGGLAESSSLLSVSVVHPSAATADALATVLFIRLCAANSGAVSADSLKSLCDEIARGGGASQYGFEMQRVIVQLRSGEDSSSAFIEWSNETLLSSSSSSSSICPEIRLHVASDAPSSGGAATSLNPGDLDVLAKLRRTMRRMIHVIFVRVDATTVLGATVSSGALHSLADKAVLSATPPERLFSPATLPKHLTALGLVFSAIRVSRLCSLLQVHLQQQQSGAAAVIPCSGERSVSDSSSCWVFQPRVSVTDGGHGEEMQRHVAILNQFAGGSTISRAELEKLIQQESSGNSFSLFAPAQLLSAPSILPVVAGTHGVFALRLNPPPAELRERLAASLPVIRAGRGYAVAPPPPQQPAKVLLSAPMLTPGGPTTAAVATRIAKGQFFGVTMSHVEFVCTAERSPVIQAVVPVHALSLAAFENFNLPVGPEGGAVCRLHVFSDHSDALSLLSWFADPAFMSGSRTEHFMYLPSAATDDEAAAYMFPGSPGRAGALFALGCRIVHVGNLTLLSGGEKQEGVPAVILMMQPISAKQFSQGGASVPADQSQPTCYWR